jgi:hypothetical protein
MIDRHVFCSFANNLMMAIEEKEDGDEHCGHNQQKEHHHSDGKRSII